LWAVRGKPWCGLDGFIDFLRLAMNDSLVADRLFALVVSIVSGCPVVVKVVVEHDAIYDAVHMIVVTS
jgi:hypothetical protein